MQNTTQGFVTFQQVMRSQLDQTLQRMERRVRSVGVIRASKDSQFRKCAAEVDKLQNLLKGY